MMRGQTVSALFFIAVLSLFAGDVTVGCGSHGYVYGIVQQKFAAATDGGERQIDVNGSIFDVPISFYNEVQVGDTVRFASQSWTIVKRANAPAPASTPP